MGRLATDRHVSPQQCNEQLSSPLLGLTTIAGSERLAIARPIRATTIPLDETNNKRVIFAEGHVSKPGESLVTPIYVSVTEGWFEAMGVRLARGRFFDSRDTPTSTRTIIVDERLAAHFWPNQDPVGRRMYAASSNRDLSAITPETRFFTVVGVIRNISFKELTPRAQQVGAYYFPYNQSSSSAISLAVRTTGDAEAMGTAVRNAITAADRELPVFAVSTMEDRLDHALVPRRVPMLIGMAFGVVALFLAATGIYGVRPLEPIVVALVAVVLTTVSIVATLVPARRAARVSPMAALND